MNDLIEKLKQEAETALYTVPCSIKKRKKKKKPTNYALLQHKYIKSQQKVDTTFKEIMQTIQHITDDNDTASNTTSSSLSSFVHYAFSNFISSKKQVVITRPIRTLKRAVKLKAMLFTTVLIIHTFHSTHCSRWTKRGHHVLFIWKNRSKSQYQYWLNKAQLTLFIIQLICKYACK